MGRTDLDFTAELDTALMLIQPLVLELFFSTSFSTHLPGHVHSPLPAPFHFLPRLQWVPEDSQVPVQLRPVLDHQL